MTKGSGHKLKYIPILELYAPETASKSEAKKVTELHGETDKSICPQS